MVKALSFSFEQCFGPFTMLLVEGSFEMRLFRDLSNHVSRSPEVQKYIGYEDHLLFIMFKLNLNLENVNKNYNIFFVSEIFASEKVATNCSVKKITLVMGSQWVNKRLSDFAYHSES